MDKTFQRKGLGELLLYYALYQSQTIADKAGCFAVEVIALDSAAAAFYAKHDFAPVDDESPLHLYRTMKNIRKLGLGQRFGSGA